MSNLKKIQIKNLRCLQDIEIDTNQRLTLIYGRNGTGKSTISTSIKYRNVLHNQTGQHKEHPTEKCSIDLDWAKDKVIHIFNDQFVYENLYADDNLTQSDSNKNNIILKVGEDYKNIAVLQNDIKDKNKNLNEKYNDLLEKTFLPNVERLTNKDKTSKKYKSVLYDPYTINNNKIDNGLQKLKEDLNILPDHYELADTTSLFNELNSTNDVKGDNILFNVETLQPLFSPELITILSEQHGSDSFIDKFTKDYVNKSVTTDWFNEGATNINDKTQSCPFCQQDISHILKDFLEYNDNTSKQIKDDLIQERSKIENSLRTICTIAKESANKKHQIDHEMKVLGINSKWALITDISKDIKSFLDGDFSRKVNDLAIKIEDHILNKFNNLINDMNKDIKNNKVIIDEIKQFKNKLNTVKSNKRKKF